MSALKPQRTISVNWLNPSRIEIPAVAADQMRKIDRIAMEATGNLFAT
jgi:hypothetical protein